MSKFNRYLTSILLLLSGTGFSQSAIAVMDFEPSGIPAHEASLLSDRLRNELVRLGVYRVVEREMMTEILDEQGFQQSGCTSSECLVEAGRLIGVRRIIGGRIGNIGSVYTVSARLIDVETGELIRVTDYDTNQGGRQILSGGMAEVAKVLSGVPEESEPNRFGKLARLKSAALTMKKSIRSFSLDDRLIISSGIPLGRGGITYQIGYVILLDNPTWTTLWSYPVLGYSFQRLIFIRMQTPLMRFITVLRFFSFIYFNWRIPRCSPNWESAMYIMIPGHMSMATQSWMTVYCPSMVFI